METALFLWTIKWSLSPMILYGMACGCDDSRGCFYYHGLQDIGREARFMPFEFFGVDSS